MQIAKKIVMDFIKQSSFPDVRNSGDVLKSMLKNLLSC